MVFKLKVEHLLQETGKLDLPPCRGHGGISLPPTVGGLLLFLFAEVALKFDHDLVGIGFVVEIADEIFAFFIGDFSVNTFVHSIVYFCYVFVGHFCFDVHLQQVVYRCLELGLDEAELFVDFVSKDLSEDSDVVILG
jgi:hypothetical protein